MERREDVRSWFKEVKSQVSCKECNASHPAFMEWHHRDPKDKKFSISAMVHNGFEICRVQDEMAKCDVLCSNCHKLAHWDDCSGKTKQYGTQMSLNL